MKPSRQRFPGGLSATLFTLAMIAAQGHAAGGLPAQFEGIPVVSSEANGTARNLRATVECQSTEVRMPAITFEWSPSQPIGAQQRVLISIYGFREGRFEASDSLVPTQSKLAWARVHGQAIHSWTVLTLQGGVWRASEVETFTGPTCVADMQPAAKR